MVKRGFMKRHTGRTLRKPESSSLSRATGFNKHRVDEFFTNYISFLKKIQFTAEQIYNLDETSSTIIIKPIKVVFTTGKRQIP